MLSYRVLAVVAVLIAVVVPEVMCQDGSDLEGSLEKNKNMPDNFDDTCGQLEDKGETEEEFDEDFDDKYDSDFHDKPPADLARDELDTLLSRENIALSPDTKYEELSVYHHYSVYHNLVTYKCCPRTQNYGCRSYYRRLPCFTRWINGNSYTCCPVHPNWAVFAAYCNCRKCAVLTPYCASVGYCHRRYTKRRLLAVCYGKWIKPAEPEAENKSDVSLPEVLSSRKQLPPIGVSPWGWFTYWVTMYVPTSCYCKTHC